MAYQPTNNAYQGAGQFAYQVSAGAVSGLAVVWRPTWIPRRRG